MCRGGSRGGCRLRGVGMSGTWGSPVLTSPLAQGRARSLLLLFSVSRSLRQDEFSPVHRGFAERMAEG